MKKRLPDLLALFLAILAGFGNVSSIVFNYLKTPSGTQYLGTNSFYPPDYLFYLSYLVRGLKGHWQIFNPLSEDGKIGFWVIHWPYIIIGQLSRLFSLSAPAGYWVGVFLLTCLIVFSAYIFLKLVFSAIDKNYLVFPTLFVYLFAGPFLKVQQNPFKFEVWRINWYYQADFFERISTIPHHLVSNWGVMIFFICSLTFFNSLKKENFLRSSFLAFFELAGSLLLVMSINPLKLTYLLPALGISFLYGIFANKRIRFASILVHSFLLIFLGLILFLFGLYFQKNVALYNLFAEIAAWEKSISRWPDLKNFILGSGPVFVLAISGLLIIGKQIVKFSLPPSIIMGISASILSYALFFTRLASLLGTHNARFLFPDAYLFMAIVIFLAIDSLIKGKSFKRTAIFLVTILIICFSAPTVYFVLKARSSDHRDFEHAKSVYKYLPDEIVEGFQFLDRRSSDHPLVLTTTVSGMGMLVPVFTEARVYAYRSLSTIDFPRKAKNCNDFFTGVMSGWQKINFLRQEKIDYLVISIYDFGSPEVNNLRHPYFISKDLPLELIFINSQLAIYKVI